MYACGVNSDSELVGRFPGMMARMEERMTSRAYAPWHPGERGGGPRPASPSPKDAARAVRPPTEKEIFDVWEDRSPDDSRCRVLLLVRVGGGKRGSGPGADARRGPVSFH
jgi:hypothetical protein